MGDHKKWDKRMAAKPSLRGESPQLHPKLPEQSKRRKFSLPLLVFLLKIPVLAWKFSPIHFQETFCLKYLEDEEGRHYPGMTGTICSQKNLLDKFGRVG